MSEVVYTPAGREQTGPNVFIEHWVKARIDSPLATISRMDEAAKQIITVGGILQAVLVVVVKFDHSPLKLTRYMATLSITAAVALLLTIACAALVVCIQPRELNPGDVYKLLKSNHTSESVSEAVSRWCGNISRVARRKQLMMWATVTMLIVSLLASVLCISAVVNGRVG